MKDYILMFGPVAFYFIAKLLRYWLLTRDDCGRSNFGDKIIGAFWILFFILSLPISVAGFAIDSLYYRRFAKAKTSSDDSSYVEEC